MAQTHILLDRSAFMAQLRTATPWLVAQAMAVQHAMGERIVARARQLAPDSQDPGDPHPGRLKADISIQGEGVDWLEVGTTVEEGFFSEFGTVNEAPRPFMRPAIAEAEAGL